MIGPTLVEVVTPAIVSVTLTSLGRRISSGKVMPGTVTSAGAFSGCSTPSSADLTGGNASFVRFSIHHGLAGPSPEPVCISRTVLSGRMTIGVRSTSDAPLTETSLSVIGAVP